MRQPGEEKESTRTRPAASAVLKDGAIVELLYRPKTRSTTFAVWRNGEWEYKSQITDEDGTSLKPFSPENNLIRNEAVLLPSEPLEYESSMQLVSDIRSFLRKYADMSEEFEWVATYYVILSWLYDCFNELPYLRLRGDFGTGKTRILLTIGSICYKPFFASGASTVSPIFHTLEAFRGTFVFDEADFRFSDERAEIVKILNNGNVRGLPVLRTIMNRQKEFNPQAFQVFGPKLVATRSTYDDKGLESRFLTEELGGRPLRDDVPINLPEGFKEEARALRNKLLLFRFHKRPRTTVDSSLWDPGLEPRLNQILMPLLSVVEDERNFEPIRWVAERAQKELVAERGLRLEAHVLEVIAELLETEQRLAIPVKDITKKLIERHGSDYERSITNRWVGSILRKRLNLRAYKSNGVFVVPVGERRRISMLCSRYGIPIPKSATHLGT